MNSHGPTGIVNFMSTALNKSAKDPGIDACPSGMRSLAWRTLLAIACAAIYLPASADDGVAMPLPKPAASGAETAFQLPPPFTPGVLWHRLLRVVELKRRDVDVAHVQELLDLHFPAANHESPRPASRGADPIYGIDYVAPRKDWYFNVSLNANDEAALLADFTFRLATVHRVGQMDSDAARSYCMDAEDAKADIAGAGWRLSGSEFSDVGLHGMHSGHLLADYVKGNRTLRLWYTTPTDATNADECVGELDIMQGTLSEAPRGFADLPTPASPMDVLRNLSEAVATSAPLYHPFYSVDVLQHIFNGNGVILASNFVMNEDATMKTSLTAGADSLPMILHAHSTSPNMPSLEFAGDPTATIDLSGVAPFGLKSSAVRAVLRPGGRWTSRVLRSHRASAAALEARTTFENGDDTRGEIIVRSKPDGVVDSVHIILGIVP